MINSGAFTALGAGDPELISLPRYCDYLEEMHDRTWACVALDVIPSHLVDYEQAPVRSFNNYLYMKRRGLDVIPVYHAGEAWGWLDSYLDEGASYIGLSPSRNSVAPRRAIGSARPSRS